MKTTRRALLGAAVVAAQGAAQTGGGVKRYARYLYQNRTRIGLVEGEMIRELRGELLGQHKETGAKHRLQEVKLLYPVAQPSKILALAGNYKSHLGNRPPAKFPEPFYKPPSSLQNPEDAIVYPKDATNLHPECELVIVMGKRASKIGVAEAKAAIFGVTCGNDVSEREWQNGAKKDIQWWRAKGADTFSPVGPWVVTGLDYGNLKIECRINGKTVQSDHTSQLIHNCETTVSYISQYVTLEPGDLIFTGTNGQTVPMKVGDVVEVEIEGIGVLRNKVVAG
jgi:2-keto-4-pentenoate hydratase/2-oxohepta-3-ene-1,7-dioic acid hydratase in catechol pathway